MSLISHSIVVCTQGRSHEFETLIKCLNKIAQTIPIELIVVANSSAPEENETVLAIFGKYNEFNSKEYLVSSPGLPRSRNLGKSKVRGKYVTFLDDDIEISLSYFESIEKRFESDLNIVGAAPYVEIDPLMWNFGDTKRKRRKKCRKSAGRVTRFGKFSWIEFAISDQLVEWLPGCAMSYRQDISQQVNFNEGLENGVTGGYALGEDADFSMKVAKKGKLVGISSESILHKISPISRASSEQMEFARGSWLGYLIREFPEKFSNSRIVLMLLLNFIVVLLGVRTRSGLSRFSLTTASLRIKGFIDEKIHSRLLVGTNR